MAWRVLIVEDEGLVALDVETAFTDAGALIVGPLATVAEAMSLSLHRFDAAAIDIRLQDGLSHPFALKLKTAGIPFVLTTGYPCHDLPRELEGSPCLMKPIPSDLIVSALIAQAAALGRPAELPGAQA